MLYYHYGVRQPEGWSNYEDEIVRRQDALWNQLCDIEHDAQTKYRALLHQFEPAIADMERRLQTIQWKRRHNKPYDIQQFRELSANLRQLRGHATAECADALTRLRQDESHHKKVARQTSQLWWHHYQQVIADFHSACRTSQATYRSTPRSRAGHEPMLPRNRHFHLQFPRALAVEDFANNKSPLLRLSGPPPDTGPRSRQRLLIDFATGRLPDGSYKYLRLPVQWHRPLPPGATIHHVRLTEVATPRPHWTLTFTVEAPPTIDTAVLPAACGIDFGWRMTPAGVRVAYWVGTDGARGELFLPPAWVDKARHLDYLRSHLKESAETLLNTITPHLARRGITDLKSYPVRALMALEKTDALRGTPAETHLRDWWMTHRRAVNESLHLTRRLHDARRDIYQKAAADITGRYRTLYVEKLALHRLKALQKDTTPFDVRRVQDWASLTTLYDYLDHHATKRGGVLHPLLPIDSTIRCHCCGHINKVSTLKQCVTCENCNTLWDQDENAARNFLATGLATDSNPAPNRKVGI